MSVKKSDSEYTDAKGNLHKQFADDRSEIYIGGYDKGTEYVEVTDGADEAVNRKRFLRYVAPPVDETVQHNDPEIATRAEDADQLLVDLDTDEFCGQHGAMDKALPGIDSLESDDDEN